MNWIGNHRILAAAGLLLLVVWTIRNSGVREVNRAQEPVNFAVMDAHPAPGDWPWWHGTTQSNTVPLERPLTHWSPADSSNGWVVPISGRGRTALCLWGEQLFLPMVDAGRSGIDLLCLNPATGRLIWQTELHRGDLLPLPPRSSPASPTPACDGQHVFMACPADGSLYVSAVDLAGRKAWQREVGPYFSRWGYSSSPAIYKSLVIVAADNKGSRINQLGGASYLAALHRQSGEVVWRVHRPEADSFGTPIVAHIAGRDQLVMAGREMVASYDPMTGQQLWSCQWSGDRVSNSIAFDENCVYATTRYHQPELLCIRADGTGDVTRTHVAWRTNKIAADLPSPVCHEGLLYVLSDEGTLSCLESGSGKPMWKRRLPGTVSSTPVIAGDHLYCCTDDGKVFVIPLGGRGEVVAEIPLGEPMFVAPIVSRNRLYFRTIAGLHCVKGTEEGPVANQPEAPRRRL
jgi:outer membrane protein assembly factor BamB